MPSSAQAIPGVYSGMYRIEVSSNQISIPEKYNTQTELGVEVSPTALRDGDPDSSTSRFNGSEIQR